MKKTKNFFFAGLAVAALAAGGFSYSNAADSQSQLSAVQLETIEALSKYESAFPCPGACLEWSGDKGGGIACDCGRHYGSCKKYCN